MGRLRDVWRALTRPVVAAPRTRDVFVFSGGGPLGAAQAGMVKALLDAGIVPVATVGCSVGALNAAFVAADPSPVRGEELAALWLGLTRDDVFPGSAWKRARNFLRHRDRLVDPSALRSLIARSYPHRDLSDAVIPVHVVTTDLAAGAAVFHRSGDPVEVLTASAAIPGVFPPVLLDGRLHVDGGVSCLVPVQRALELGDRVWVFDVAGADHANRVRAKARLGALDLLGLALSVAMRTQANNQHHLADPRVHVITITGDPAAMADNPLSFDRTAALIKAGEAAAKNVLARVL